MRRARGTACLSLYVNKIAVSALSDTLLNISKTSMWLMILQRATIPINQSAVQHAPVHAQMHQRSPLRLQAVTPNACFHLMVILRQAANSSSSTTARSCMWRHGVPSV